MFLLYITKISSEFNPDPNPHLPHVPPCTEPVFLLYTTKAAFGLLWASAGLAAWSLSFYMSNVWTHMVCPQTKGK